MPPRPIRSRFLVSLAAALVANSAPALAKPSPQPFTNTSESVFPYLSDATLVQLAIDRARACMLNATLAMDEAATNEVLALVEMFLEGASNQAILDYAAESSRRLDAAAYSWGSKARAWLENAEHELRRRHGFVPPPFGEVIGVAGLTMDSDYLVRARIRLGEIYRLVDLLTR